MEIVSLFGILTVIFVFYKFLIRLGNTIPVLELMLLLAGLQWIVGPFIEYSSPSGHYKYYMYVSELDYMNFIVPAYLLFVLGVLIPLSNTSRIILSVNSFSNQSKFGLLLLLLGVVSDLLIGFVPGSLKFFFYLLSNFKFAGSIVLFFSKDKKFRIIFYLSLLYLFYNSLQNALFHDFILWSIFFYMFWAVKFKPSIKNILFTFLLGILSLTTLQTVKSAYRGQIWGGYSGNKIELFFGLVVESIFTNGLFEEVSENDAGNNVRLNQGWIISAVMDNIPNNQDFLGGETITDAFVSSIFPRFLMPGKELAGGRKNFELFTGLNLGVGTSMGISIIGESYGNYGVILGACFMFLWGLFLALIRNKLFRFISYNFLYICFIPLIFLQVVKAETELVVVLNYLFKSLIIVFLFIYVYKRYSFNK